MSVGAIGAGDVGKLYPASYLNQGNVNFKTSAPNKLERNPQKDSVEKQGMSIGTKVALGAVATVGALALIDAIACKGKHIKKLFGKAEEAVTGTTTGGTTGTASNSIEAVFKNGKAYNDKGELFTGTLSRTSKSGHKLDSHYIDGVVVKREFTPVNQTEIKQIVKTYDNATCPGIRTAKGEILMPDGSKYYSFNAVITQREFPPEIEAKIKMKDFFDTDLSKIKTETVDLGNGLKLEYDATFDWKPQCELRHNADLIARVQKLNEHKMYGISNAFISKDKNGSFEEMIQYVDEGSKIIYPDGTSKLLQIFRLTDEGTRQYLPRSEQVIKTYDALGNLISEVRG